MGVKAHPWWARERSRRKRRVRIHRAMLGVNGIRSLERRGRMRAKLVGTAVVHLMVVRVEEVKGLFTALGFATNHDGPGPYLSDDSQLIDT